MIGGRIGQNESKTRTTQNPTFHHFFVDSFILYPPKTSGGRVRAVCGLGLGGLRRNEVSMKAALYKVGYRAELRAKAILEEWGFYVLRSARSGGLFDLVAFDGSKILLISVKVCPTGKMPKYAPQKRKLKALPAPANSKKEVWVWERKKGFHYMPV